MPKLKQISFEPESNQRSKDSQHFIHSALLYQLRYRKMGKPQATTLTKNIENLTSWDFKGNRAAFLW